MKHVLFFIAEKGFQDDEYFETKQVLEDAGIVCDCVSTDDDSAEGKFGAIVMPTVSLDSVDITDYDAIVLVGGPGAPKMGDDPRVRDVVLDAYNRKILISAICIAPTILAKYDLVAGKEVTVWPTGKDEIEGAGATYSSSPVVVDDSEEDHILITANGPDAAAEFGKAVLERLQ